MSVSRVCWSRATRRRRSRSRSGTVRIVSRTRAITSCRRCRRSRLAEPPDRTSGAAAAVRASRSPPPRRQRSPPARRRGTRCAACPAAAAAPAATAPHRPGSATIAANPRASHSTGASPASIGADSRGGRSTSDRRSSAPTADQSTKSRVGPADALVTGFMRDQGDSLLWLQAREQRQPDHQHPSAADADHGPRRVPVRSRPRCRPAPGRARPPRCAGRARAMPARAPARARHRRSSCQTRGRMTTPTLIIATPNTIDTTLGNSDTIAATPPASEREVE